MPLLETVNLCQRLNERDILKKALAYFADDQK